MPGRHEPRRSEDPKEKRMFTWRTKGSIMNKLIDIGTYFNISHNRLVSILLTKILNKIEKKIKNNEPIDKRKLLDPNNEDIL